MSISSWSADWSYQSQGTYPSYVQILNLRLPGNISVWELIAATNGPHVRQHIDTEKMLKEIGEEIKPVAPKSRPISPILCGPKDNWLVKKSPPSSVTTAFLKTPCCSWSHQNSPSVCATSSPEPWMCQHRLPRRPFRRGQAWQQHNQSSGHSKWFPLVWRQQWP